MTADRSPLALTDDEIAAFHEDGYVVRKGLFSTEEVAFINEAVNTDPTIREAIYGRVDASGATTELALWRHLGDDIFGAVARSKRVVDSLESVLGGEVCFFHAKLTLKRPNVGGAWDWHQDYGYWYRDGYLYPNMASVFIALDPSTRQNGCLQVLKGSHKLGRIDHGKIKGQLGADMTYVEQAIKRMDLVHCEMTPGDALFFHANTLHASGQNTSDKTRNVLLCCYNRADNAPFVENPSNTHSPIKKLPDEMVSAYCGRAIDTGREFNRA